MDINSKTLELNLIESISIPGIGNIPQSGLIVLVGPNSSGKTQLLRDIYEVLMGNPRELVVANNITFSIPEKFNSFLDALQKEGYIDRYIEDIHKNEIIKKKAPGLGVGGGIGEIARSKVESGFNQLRSYKPSEKKYEQNVFLNHFGHFLSTSLMLSNRRTIVGQQSNFDYENTPPNNDIQALYLNKKAKKELLKEVQDTFGKSLWLDNTRGNILCLRVKDSKEMPTDAEMREPGDMSKYRTIENEGDGLKSYVGVCISLLLGRRPICLIDEPELCLHPPQAYALGKFIGKHSEGSLNLTIVATHSSHLLRGIIEGSSNSCILRLTNNSEGFNGRYVDPTILKDFTKRPIVKTETVLDGIFSNAVVLVESEGDRLVYETTWEKLSISYLFDIRFISVGGTGGFKEVLRFYDMLHVPACIIADLDIILDDDKFKSILEELSTNENFRSDILDRCCSFKNEYLKITPSISFNELSDQLNEIIKNKHVDWANNDDIEIRRNLLKITNELHRNKKLKCGGVKNFKTCLGLQLTEIINKLKEVGLFCVPVGELEYWIQDVMGDCISKNKKAEWAHVAAQKIRELDAREDDVWGFIKSIAVYLSNNLETIHINRKSSNTK